MQYENLIATSKKKVLQESSLETKEKFDFKDAFVKEGDCLKNTITHKRFVFIWCYLHFTEPLSLLPVYRDMMIHTTLKKKFEQENNMDLSFKNVLFNVFITKMLSMKMKMSITQRKIPSGGT